MREMGWHKAAHFWIVGRTRVDTEKDGFMMVRDLLLYSTVPGLNNRVMLKHSSCDVLF